MHKRSFKEANDTTKQGREKRKKVGLKLSALHEIMGLIHQPHYGGVKLRLRHAALSQSSAVGQF
jgi:hypothetical protein